MLTRCLNPSKQMYAQAVRAFGSTGTMLPESELPTYADVVKAAANLKGVANITPVNTSRRLNEELGAEIFFKCENFQRSGAFKFRGAYNALSMLSDEQKKGGVVGYSTGNHAIALAQAGALLGIKATIVMPH